jgi:hypothetical protein
MPVIAAAEHRVDLAWQRLVALVQDEVVQLVRKLAPHGLQGAFGQGLCIRAQCLFDHRHEAIVMRHDS